MDKKSQLKTIFALIVLTFLSVIITNAVFTDTSSIITLASPSLNSYEINNTVTFIVNGTMMQDRNISWIQLWTDASGTWAISNQTNFTSVVNGQSKNATANISQGLSVIIRGIADASIVKWNALYNYTNGTNSDGSDNSTLLWATSNSTVYVEYAPIVTLNKPTSAGWTKNTSDTFNFTVVSPYTSVALFACNFYSNETGTWGVSKSGISASNNTPYYLDYQLAELTDIRWNVQCAEVTNANVNAFAASNFTIKIDRTPPVIAITHVNNKTLSNGTYTRETFPIINYTLTESNKNTCTFYVNNSINSTDTTISNKNFTLNSGEGVFNYRIGCDDSAGNLVNSSTYQLIVDRTPPVINGIGNLSVSGSADKRKINISTNELTNITIFYGAGVTTLISSNSSFSASRNIILGNLAENTAYYYNLSLCDRAGNCNNTIDSYGQFDFTFPWKVLGSGWSYFGVSDGKINFSTILSQTESEFVYYWNQTGQKWVSATSGGSTNMGFQVGSSVNERTGGPRIVVALFESTNSTWARNTTDIGYYHINISSGDNFLKLPTTPMTFGNLSRSFLNGSYHEGAADNADYEFNTKTSIIGTGGLDKKEYNLTDFYFSAYNNSANTWTLSYVYNYTKNNNTIITSPSISEVIWVGQPYNLTYNGTNIKGNWSAK